MTKKTITPRSIFGRRFFLRTCLPLPAGGFPRGAAVPAFPHDNAFPESDPWAVLFERGCFPPGEFDAVLPGCDCLPGEYSCAAFLDDGGFSGEAAAAILPGGCKLSDGSCRSSMIALILCSRFRSSSGSKSGTIWMSSPQCSQYSLSSAISSPQLGHFIHVLPRIQFRTIL